MVYIEGCTLIELWDSLNEERKRNIIDTLAGYVQELRSIRLIPIKCMGSFLTETDAGPFTSYAALTAWLDRKKASVQPHAVRGHDRDVSQPRCDASARLVPHGPSPTQHPGRQSGNAVAHLMECRWRVPSVL